MREVIFHSIGFFKLLCEEVPLFCIRFQIEGVSQEIVGCCIFGVYTLQTIGLASIPSSTSAFLTGLYVGFVPLLQWLIYKSVPQPVTIATIVLAFTGMTLFANPFSVNLSGQFGEWVTVLSALICAAEILSISHFTQGCRPLQLSFTQLIAVAILALFTLL